MKCTFGCKGDSDKIGVLIAQLGTPEAPTARALKPYLKQFLWDPRVIEGNRVLWWFVLNFIVLTKRPKRSAKLYKRIWTEEGSPLLVLTRRQTELVADSLSQVDPDIEVTFGMRYGEPSLECAVDDLIKRGCSRILLFPMYPQYSATSSASTYDVVFPHLLKRRWVPTLRVAEPFYSDPGYIEPQAERINRGLRAMQEPPEFLILSYHGIPQSYVDKGDTYCLSLIHI